MSYAEFVAEVRACLDGRVWQDGFKCYKRLFAALKKAENALSGEQE